MERPFSLFWQRITWRALVIEAACYLLSARIALKVVPFKRLSWFFELPVRQPERTGPERDKARNRVRRAVEVATRRLPLEIVCFPRAIAAQAMLRRRRIATVLYYGASTRAGLGLEAHVWVLDGTQGVVGETEAEGFSVLAQFPNNS